MNWLCTMSPFALTPWEDLAAQIYDWWFHFECWWVT